MKSYHEHDSQKAILHQRKAVHHQRFFVLSLAALELCLLSTVFMAGLGIAQMSRKFALFELEVGGVSGGAAVENNSLAAGGKLVRFKQTATPTPTPVPTPTPTPTPAPSAKIRRFPGDPNPKVYKKAYWGSSIDGNGDPARHETPTGTSLSVRRTFYQWSDATNTSSKLYTTVSNDQSKNRLPFVSIKTPGWKAVADGTYDANIDAMLRKLDSYGKPVWLSVHHEPEGGGGSNVPDDAGGAPEWRRMQSKIRERMNAVGTKNVAFMPILMSYTWNTASGRTPNDWWVSGIWDAYCVDHYRDNVSGDMLSAHWSPFVSWVEVKGLPYCIGEWGNRGTDIQAANELQAFWDWSFTNNKDLVAYAYFDSALNSDSGSWVLTGEPLTKFQNILKTDTRVQRINSL